MKRPILVLLSIFILFFLYLPTPIFSQDMNKIDLGGNWQFRRAGTSKWMDAIVPGEVHLDLLRNKIISDPFFRDNEKYQQWIGEIGWEYEKKFFISDTLFSRRNIELVCKGLDTYANVFLNDSLIIVADNMFRTWYASIKPVLRIGLNTLRIQFPSIIEENKSRYSKLNYKLPGDEKVVCRKAAYQFGWDWGPTFITSGIWQPIYIRYWDYVNVLGVQYIQKSLTDSLAKLTAEFTVTSVLADSSLFKISVNGNDIAKHWATLKKGVNVVQVDFEIKNPKRWWTNGLGEHHLYAFEHEVYFAKRLYGKGMTRIGLRTLELVQEKDSIGRSFYFKLNGVPVFMKGANYIPLDNFLTRVKDTNYRDIVRNAAADNMNMLRVWGGGIYEKDAFYDYCDESGILVWQDFMFACAMYPGGKEFQDNVMAEAIQNIVRLRNHPCIALWCGNNEVDEGWKNWGWSKQYNYSTQDSIEINANSSILFGILLKNAVRNFDPLVPYIKSSPKYGWGNAESLKEGDVHYWGVWHGKEPFSMFRNKVGRFVSEYGFQAFPDMATIRKFSSPPDLNIDSPVMKAHQKSPIGYERIDEYLLHDYKRPKNFDSYVYVSQLLQAEGIKIAIEAHRRAMPRCMGTLYWQLNDCWPVVSWSSIDYYGKKKALGYWLKSEYAMTLISPVVEDDRIKVYIISDNLIPQKADLSIELIDFSGNTLWNKSISLEIPANSSLVVFDTASNSLTGNRKTNEILLLTTIKNGNQVVSENSLYFDSPKNLNLQLPTIQKQVKEIPEGYKIELNTNQLAKDIFLSIPYKGEFSENYFDIVPGRTKTIIFTTKRRNGNMADLIRITSLYDTY